MSIVSPLSVLGHGTPAYAIMVQTFMNRNVLIYFYYKSWLSKFSASP